jgi:hypothetical protein
MKRRDFLTTTAGVAAGASLLSNPVGATVSSQKKKRVAMVGTGVRGIGFREKPVVDNYSDVAEFVGLWDITKSQHDMDLYVKNEELTDIKPHPTRGV